MSLLQTEEEPKPNTEQQQVMKNPDIIQNLEGNQAKVEAIKDETSKIKEDEVLVAQHVQDERSKIEILSEKQREMEKENKRKKELLKKAIAER